MNEFYNQIDRGIQAIFITTRCKNFHALLSNCEYTLHKQAITRAKSTGHESIGREH